MRGFRRASDTGAHPDGRRRAHVKDLMDLTGLLPALLADPAAAEAVASVRARGELDVVGPAGIR